MSRVTKLDADEAIKRKGSFGSKDEELLKDIEKSQDDRFTDIYSLTFGWKKQPQTNKDIEPEDKLMSMLPNGKICFIDRSQDETEIVPEDSYICLIYERPREAFAKILFPEYQPKIYVPSSRLPAMVWRDDKGKIHNKVPMGSSYEERIISAIKEMENMGIYTVKIVFRKNVRGE